MNFYIENTIKGNIKTEECVENYRKINICVDFVVARMHVVVERE